SRCLGAVGVRSPSPSRTSSGPMMRNSTRPSSTRGVSTRITHLMIPLTPSDPHRLGRYWLAGRLGAGGQGVVYEAYGEEGERVAVKVPRVDDPESRARLAREAAAAARVASFCTARIIEVAEPYIVSEFVP